MPRKFISQDPGLALSHPDLKTAAGNQQFVLQFRKRDEVGLFQTANNALANALAGLVEAGKVKGVKELSAPAKSEPKQEPKPDEEASNGTRSRRGQRD